MPHRDIHAEITGRIVAAIEAGTPPWRKDWAGGIGQLPRRHNGENYKGINILLLWMASDERSFKSDTWLTFRQARASGGAVRKGETGTGIVFFKTVVKAGEGGEKDQRFGFLKHYTVFNIDQIDGLDVAPVAPVVAGGAAAIPDLESFFAATGATIKNGPSMSPHYNPHADTIGMPPVEAFTSALAYYGTLAHELIHWTAHGTRLDRDTKYQTTTGRAFEELIAEIGSCFLCAHIGADRTDIENNAAYVAGWLKALKSDKRFIFRAASAAQAASEFALLRGRPRLAVAA